jgi:ribokinase
VSVLDQSLPLWLIGYLALDDIVMPDGTTSMAQIAGNALYSALGARIWASSVVAAARVGPDFPKDGLEAISAGGVTLALQRVPWPSIREWGLYETLESLQWVSWMSSGTHSQQGIRHDELPATIRQAAGCHVAPMPPKMQTAVVSHLRAIGVPIVTMDPLAMYVDRHEEHILSMLPQLSAFLPSRVEAARLFGRDDPEGLIADALGAGTEAVAVKLGGEGSLVACARATTPVHVPALRVAVVDPTGAGDSYCGGFLAGLVATGDPLVAACRGTVSASFAVEGRGSPSLATADPVQASARFDDLAATLMRQNPRMANSTRLALRRSCSDEEGDQRDAN